ncbi:hypothetical protein IGI04_002280 [Brassica rapa subsp. trilocularis]|uniref:Copine C-terminal domain-containing protein n=1 Tax=Brassica rapa subsp. trilocularis TaxID=1813537 RepID=A0ABQ7NV27_BRACM|nr:hypothetical protein IGI04_002280 [Brassica rapa subsp. trilocularis]
MAFLITSSLKTPLRRFSFHDWKGLPLMISVLKPWLEDLQIDAILGLPDKPCEEEDGIRFLTGLTSFARIIERAMTIVEESGGRYHVLLIIADGQITKDVLELELEFSYKHSERHLLGDPFEESDAALNQSLWGASSSAEHHQQQQQQGMSSYQANIITIICMTNASNSATSHNIINGFFRGWMV